MYVSGMKQNAGDIIVVGAGLAGLVAAHEAVKAGRKVVLVEQESRANLGGQAFMDNGIDWVAADTVEDLVRTMNELGDIELDGELVRKQSVERDAQLTNIFSKDAQVNYIRTARNFLGDKLVRCAEPHRLLDPKKGPLIAVKLHVLTRKTLCGIETDLNGRALLADGSVFPGLYACGEAAGFGGGGMHGKNALEGTFLGGCIHSGKRVGENAARE